MEYDANTFHSALDRVRQLRVIITSGTQEPHHMEELYAIHTRAVERTMTILERIAQRLNR